MQNIIFSQIPIEDFKNVITETIREELKQFNSSKPQPETTELITRQETARILDISLPTLNDWTKKGIVTGYRIATRVRYNKNEILTSLKQIHTLKYRRG